jgi:DNA-binding MarR family transcriptional regulator
MDVPTIERAAGYLVKRVQQAFRRRSDAALRSTGVSMAQYAVLRALADHPDASASELARLCFVTRQSLQDVLAGLRAAQLVQDADTPPRGRTRSLQLTPAGRRRLTDADEAVKTVDSTMLQGLSATEQVRLVQLLERCAKNLEASGD